MSNAVYSTDLEKLPLVKRGKVRDIYSLDPGLLIVATDRISCFDSILPTPIPDKGKILTELSAFWFEFTRDIVKNHVISRDTKTLPREIEEYFPILKDRFFLVKKAEPLPLECVVRGYLAGSGYKEYLKTKTVCGIPLPGGLTQAEKLDIPIFTPSTKNETGHDLNITEPEAREIAGEKIYSKIKELSLKIYRKASAYAESRGIIIADTKFEFGLFDDEIILIDEILTPDSSRFWPKQEYSPGQNQNSFDKQFVRDYLESVNWDKVPPAPGLPEKIVSMTRDKYIAALKLLT